MNRSTAKQPLSPKLLAALLFAAAAGMGSSYATAQTPTRAEAEQRYQADVERCRSGQTSQDERTCLREAGAALEEARRNRLVTGTPSFDENQRARCDRLSGTERDDCMLLMSDPNATVHGSIEGGGVIRETTITIPADTTTPAPGAGGLTPAPAGNTMPGSMAPQSPGSGGLAPATTR